MGILIKDAGTFKGDLVKGEVSVKQSGTWKQAEQVYVKDGGTWYQMFPDLQLPRWGVGGFSDVDLMGGKSGLDQAGGAYETWTGPQDFIDSVLTTIFPDQSDGQIINYNVPFPDYLYFACPKGETGSMTPTDTGTGFPGGWDGIQWADGGFDVTAGPLEFTYDDGNGATTWYVYRTDFSGIGQVEFSIAFELTS